MLITSVEVAGLLNYRSNVVYTERIHNRAYCSPINWWTTSISFRKNACWRFSRKRGPGMRKEISTDTQTKTLI